MNRSILSSTIDILRFTYISTFFAFFFGIYWYSIPIASEHIYFFISAPIATFFPCYFIWKWKFKTKEDYKIGNVIEVALILTFITHYLNFVVLGIGRVLCHFFTGKCTDYTGQTESVLETLTYVSWLRMLISLYYFGLVTLIIFSVIGISIIKTSKLLNDNSQTEIN